MKDTIINFNCCFEKFLFFVGPLSKQLIYPCATMSMIGNMHKSQFLTEILLGIIMNVCDWIEFTIKVLILSPYRWLISDPNCHKAYPCPKDISLGIQSVFFCWSLRVLFNSFVSSQIDMV